MRKRQVKTCSTARKNAMLELELVALSLSVVTASYSVKVSDSVLNSFLWFTHSKYTHMTVRGYEFLVSSRVG